MDNKTNNSIAHAAAKAFFYVSATTIAIIWLYTAKLDPNTIEICREACASATTMMESVTSTECICANTDSSNKWVLPR